MKIMLDVSPAKLKAQTEKYGVDFWQLRTPLTNNKLAGVPYGLDNGCFGTFHEKRWERLLNDAEKPGQRPKFVCLPDIVGDARRTIELFEIFEKRTNELPRALVLQDGIENHRIPWDKIDAIFIGGSDAFKTHPATFAAIRTARILGKWVHVGRVNSYARTMQYIKTEKDGSMTFLADSIDGSGISIGTNSDRQLKEVLAAIYGKRLNQASLI